MDDGTGIGPGEARAVGLAVALAAAWVAWVVARSWGTTPKDMTALYYAARFFAEGRLDLIYDASPNLLWEAPPEAWAALSRALGEPVDQLTAYVYPPLWAALLSPLASVTGPATFYAGGIGLFAATYAAGLIAAGRTFGEVVPPLHWVGLGILLIEVTAIGRLSVGLGQTQILVTGLVLCAFAAYARGLFGRAGALLGLAAAIKLTPLFLALIFLADRNWRALAAFAVAGGALAGASVALTGWPLHADFLGRLASMGDSVLLSKITVSLVAAATMLAEGDRALMTYAWTEPSLTEPAALLLQGLLFAAVLLLRLRDPSTRGLWLALLALGLAIPLTSPLGWLHYLLLPIALAPGLLTSRPGAIALAAFALAVSVPVYNALLGMPVVWPQLYGTALTLAAFLGVVWIGLRPGRP